MKKLIIGKPIYGIAIGVFIFLLVALLITNANVRQKEQQRQQEQELQAYQNPQEPTLTESGNAEPNIEMIQYQSTSLPYVIEVPSDWVQGEEGNTVSFFHSADGANISISEMDYFGGVNNITEETLISDIGEQGELLHYDRYNNKYYAAYAIDNVVYLEETIWDRNNVIRISCTYPAESNDYYEPLCTYVIDSFNWQWEDPIPEDIFIYYNEYGNFEFGVPISWEYYIDDSGVFIAKSPNSSVMQCRITEGEFNFGNTDAETYFKDLIAGSQQHEITYFENKGNYITGDLVLLDESGLQYHVVSTQVQNNSFLYTFIFMATTDYYEEDGAAYSKALSLFRIF